MNITPDTLSNYITLKGLLSIAFTILFWRMAGRGGSRRRSPSVALNGRGVLRQRQPDRPRTRRVPVFHFNYPKNRRTAWGSISLIDRW